MQGHNGRGSMKGKRERWKIEKPDGVATPNAMRSLRRAPTTPSFSQDQGQTRRTTGNKKEETCVSVEGANPLVGHKTKLDGTAEHAIDGWTVGVRAKNTGRIDKSASQKSRTHSR